MSIVGDPDQVDQVLDSVEEAFDVVIEKFGLENEEIDRWRWDEPTIVLSWRGEDSIHRNIGAHFDEEREYVDIEANAWIDSDMDEFEQVSDLEPPDLGVVRFWSHREAEEVSLEYIKEAILDMGEIAYITESELDREQRLDV